MPKGTPPLDTQPFSSLQPPRAVETIPQEEMTPRVRVALNGLVHEIAHLRESLERAYKRIADLENLADLDSLVHVFNRRAFMRELARTISFGDRYDTTNSVLYFDLNGMKTINDTLGHGAGDGALAHVSNVLMANLRQSDIVARLGGDEFGVILVQADRPTATKKALRLADAIETTPFVWEGIKVPLSAAFGVHQIKPDDTPMTALRAADHAMYAQKSSDDAAKATGRSVISEASRSLR